MSLTYTYRPSRGGYVSDDPIGDALTLLKAWKDNGADLNGDPGLVDVAARMTGANPGLLMDIILSHAPRKY